MRFPWERDAENRSITNIFGEQFFRSQWKFWQDNKMMALFDSDGVCLWK